MKYELVRPEGYSDGKLTITVTCPDFDAIVKGADKLGGTWDVLMDVPLHQNSVLAGQEGIYVVTIMGTAYWRDGRGRSHQIGSAGFCWDCLHDGKRGLVRHPVTPDEVLNQRASYVCAVEGCGAIVNNPGSEAAQHKDIPHVIAWGEETSPRCELCGKGYQIATPHGVGFENHAEGCEYA